MFKSQNKNNELLKGIIEKVLMRLPTFAHIFCLLLSSVYLNSYTEALKFLFLLKPEFQTEIVTSTVGKARFPLPELTARVDG